MNEIKKHKKYIIGKKDCRKYIKRKCYSLVNYINDTISKKIKILLIKV